MEAEIGVMQATGQEIWEPGDEGEAKEQILSHACTKAHPRWLMSRITR